MCSTELRNIDLAGADGVQTTREPKVDADHFANTLFNVMRGGTFARGYAIESERFRSFVGDRNVDVAERHAGWLAELPDSIDVTDLRNRATDVGEADLIRLAHEYLPLSFSVATAIRADRGTSLRSVSETTTAESCTSRYSRSSSSLP